MKKTSAVLVIAVLLSADHAGAQNSVYRYKTNNRNASEGVDAAVYNPAGMIWLDDGTHVEIGNQLGFGTKNLYDGTTGITYEATGGSAFDPTAIVIRRQGRWAANLAVGASSATGGEMADGSPMLNAAGTAVAAGLASGVNEALTGPAVGLPGAIVDPFTANLYAADGGSLEERDLDVGFMANVAFEAAGWLSFSAGAKYTHRAEEVLRGNVALATDTEAVAAFARTLRNDVGLPQDQVDAIVGGIPVVAGDVARVDASYADRDYWVFSVGANFRPTRKLLVAQTVSFGPSYTAHMELHDLALIDPSLKPQLEDLLGMTFEDGAPDVRHVVPLYRLGVAYHVSARLRLEADLHVDFNHAADSADANEYAWGLGAEYQVSGRVNWGAGFKYQPVRRDPDDMTDTDFDNDMLWAASGVDVRITDRLTGVATVELGFPTSEHEYYADDGTTLLKSYTDELNKSATLGIVLSL